MFSTVDMEFVMKIKNLVLSFVLGLVSLNAYASDPTDMDIVSGLAKMHGLSPTQFSEVIESRESDALVGEAGLMAALNSIAGSDQNSELMKVVELSSAVQKWAPHLDFDQSLTFVNEQIISLPTLVPEKSGYQFGKSISFSNIHQSALSDIHQKQPKLVWDIACGHGFASYYALMAGAQKFHALDENSDVLTAMRSQIYPQLKKYMPKNLNPKQQMQFVPGDIFSKVRNQYYADKEGPEVIMCFNFLHFLAPNLQNELISFFWQKLQPGGTCYLSGDSFYGPLNGDVLLQRLRDGKDNPGYSYLDDEITAQSGFLIVDRDPDPDAIPGRVLPNEEGRGLMVYNFLHPQTMTKMFEQSEIPAESYKIYYDGFPREHQLIDADEFTPSPEIGYKLAIILSKPKLGAA